jgi:hypothetical protein
VLQFLTMFRGINYSQTANLAAANVTSGLYRCPFKHPIPLPVLELGRVRRVVCTLANIFRQNYQKVKVQSMKPWFLK